MKRPLIIAIKCLFSFAILAYLFHQAASEKQFDAVWYGQKNWLYLLIGFLGTLGAILIGFVRWFVMVRALGLPFNLKDAIRIGFIGLFFNLFAFGVIGGDALRVFYITREIPSRKPEAIASVVVDRLIGLLVMFLIATIAFLTFDMSSLETTHPQALAVIRLIGRLVIVGTIVGYVGLAGLLWIPRLSQQRWVIRMGELPLVGPVLWNILMMIGVYQRRPRVLLIGFLMSVLVNVSFVVAIYFIAAGLFDDVPSFASHFVIEPIAMVSNAVPLPGGIGGMEFALNFVYEAFGSGHGVVVAFAYRLSHLLVSAIGAFVWFLNRGSVKEMLSAEKGESTAV